MKDNKDEEKTLFQAIDAVDDKFLMETLKDMEKRKNQNHKQQLKFKQMTPMVKAATIALICFLTLGISVSVAAATSKTFRQWIQKTFMSQTIYKVTQTKDVSDHTVTEIPVSTLRISLAVSVIILAIEIIIKLFRGIKGLSAVNGNSIGKAPIILVKIGIVLMLISFIEDIIHAFSGSLNIISVAITLISLVLLIFYQKSAKNLSPTT